MLIEALAAQTLLSWLLVTADCCGRRAWIDRYLIDGAERHVVQMVACPTEDNPGAMCPVYNPFLPARIVQVAQPGGQNAVEGDRVEIAVPPCDPPPGGVCYWITTAVDIFGRKSLPTGCEGIVCPQATTPDGTPIQPLEPGQIANDADR